jgi:hypothetical protein
MKNKKNLGWDENSHSFFAIEKRKKCKKALFWRFA